MPDLKTSSGPYDVHASGMVLSYEMNDITLQLASNFKLTIRVEVDGGAGAMDFALPSPDLLVLSIKNPTSLGFGLTSPSKIGMLDGREAYIATRLDLFGTPATSYRIYYTIFLGATQ